MALIRLYSDNGWKVSVKKNAVDDFHIEFMRHDGFIVMQYKQREWSGCHSHDDGKGGARVLRFVKKNNFVPEGGNLVSNYWSYYEWVGVSH